MDGDDGAREGLNRAVKVYKAKPSQARSTTVGKATIGQGLTCQFVEGGNSAVLDMPAVIGGGASGPTPGFYGRAGITGCLAIGLKSMALLNEIEVSEIAVEIEQDWDDRGGFGIEDASATALATRVSVTICSAHDTATLRKLVDDTIKADPWFLSYRDAQPVQLDIIKVDG